MATTLSFVQNEHGHYEASCTSSGDRMAVEVNRTSPGTLIIFGCIDGLEKTILQNFGPGADQNIIFEIDVPDEVVISIVSYTEVTSAKITGV